MKLYVHLSSRQPAWRGLGGEGQTGGHLCAVISRLAQKLKLESQYFVKKSALIFDGYKAARRGGVAS